MTAPDGPDGLVLIATKCTAPAQRIEWEAWYVDEYVPSLVGGPIIAASVWTLDGAPPPGGPGPGHSHMTRIDLRGGAGAGAATLAARAAQARGDDRLHPAHAEIAVELWSTHGPAHAPLDTDAARTAMIVAEVMCTDPAREREWDRWYDDQHLPDMLGSEAFAAASRWIRTPRRGAGCDHLTVYEIAGFDAAEAVRRSAAVMPGLAAAGRKHECHTGGRTLALDRAEPSAE